MSGVDLGAGRHAELPGHALDLSLYAGTHAHLRIGQLAVHLAIFLRQRDFRPGLLGGIDPQIEQSARRIELSSRLAVLGQFVLENGEGALAALQQQRGIRGHRLLIVEARLQQRLPAFLLLAARSECRHAEQTTDLSFPRLQHRFGVLHPLFDACRARTGALREHRRERIFATAEHAFPCVGDIARSSRIAGELLRDLLHLSEPCTGLCIHALDGRVDRCPAIARPRRPQIQHLLPSIRLVAGLRRHLAPRVPVLPRQRIEILRPAIVRGVHAISIQPAIHQCSMLTPRFAALQQWIASIHVCIASTAKKVPKPAHARRQ